MRFNFTGNLAFNGEETKNPWIKNGTTKNGADYKSFNCAVVVNDNNRGYVELFGMVQDTIKTINSSGEKIDIDWDDRLDPDCIENVSNLRKNVIKIGDDRSEFITPYDAIEYLEDHQLDLKDGKYTITGTVSKNVYNGTVSNRFVIQNIYPANDDAPNKLMVDAEMLYTYDDIDISNWKEEHKIYFNAYTDEYIDGSKRFVQQQFVFDASKIKFDNDKHLDILEFRLSLLGLNYDRKSNKVTIAIKKKKIYKMSVKCVYVNGAEEIEFDESQLTKIQKDAIKFGEATLEDFKPRGRIYGQRIQKFKISKFNLKDDYCDGLVMVEDMTEDEFVENIFVAAEKQETVKEVIKETESVPFDENVKEDEEESLFD